MSTPRETTRLRWLLRDIFSLFERAEKSETSLGPEEAFDGEILVEWKKLEDRAKEFGLK